MKKYIVTAFAVSALAALSGCATPTPYQPASTASGYHWGYSDTRIEEGRYRLGFSGNDLTPRETVENYMLYHAAEVTLANGYDWFEIVHRDTDTKTRTVTTLNDPFMSSVSWRFYRGSRWSAWGAWGDPFGDDFDSVQYTRYEATAEIVMHKGAKPDGMANAYDARALRGNLDARIVRPADRPVERQ